MPVVQGSAAETAPAPTDADLLFKEAKRRERRRRLAWIGGAVLVLAAGVFGLWALFQQGGPARTQPGRSAPRPPAKSSSSASTTTVPPPAGVLWQLAANVLSVSPNQMTVQDVNIHPQNPAWDTFMRTVLVTPTTEYYLCGPPVQEVGSDDHVRIGAEILYYADLPHGAVPADIAPQQSLTAVSVTEGCSPSG
jgi:hypothetical protein